MINATLEKYPVRIQAGIGAVGLGAIGYGLARCFADTKAWQRGVENDDPNVNEYQATRGLFTSVLSASTLGLLNMGLDIFGDIDPMTSTPLMSMIVGNITGYILDAGIASKPAFDLTKSLNMSDGMKEGFGVIASIDFFRYLVTVMFDLFVSNLLMQGIRQSFGEKGFITNDKWRSFVPTLLGTLVSFVTFQMYTNQSRFQYALRISQFKKHCPTFADFKKQAVTYNALSTGVPWWSSSEIEDNWSAMYRDEFDNSEFTNAFGEDDDPNNYKEQISALKTDVERIRSKGAATISDFTMYAATAIAGALYMLTPMRNATPANTITKESNPLYDTGIHQKKYKALQVLLTCCLIFALVYFNIDNKVRGAKIQEWQRLTGVLVYSAIVLLCSLATWRTTNDKWDNDGRKYRRIGYAIAVAATILLPMILSAYLINNSPVVIMMFVVCMILLFAIMKYFQRNYLTSSKE